MNWRRRTLVSLAYAIWVVVVFWLAQLLLLGVFQLLIGAGVPLAAIGDTILNTLVSAVVYILALGMVLGLPWWIVKKRTTLKELGFDRLLGWMDLLLAPAGLIVYFLLSAGLLFLASQLNGFDPQQIQDIGFQNLSQQYEYILAFLILVIVAPVAEELLFRGYFYGKVRRQLPAAVSIALVSLVFALMHLPGFDAAGNFQWQWNVVVDIFALSIVLAVLRETTGSIWAGIVLHMMKNAIAYYVLFVNPMLG